VALSIQGINRKVQDLRTAYRARDGRMSDVLQVRIGRAQNLIPELFPEAWPKPIVANFIDVAARDLSELLAPLPALNCSSGAMLSDRAKKFADKRTRIAHHYSFVSDLQRQMFSGADQYISYGFMVFELEPDFEKQVPRIKVENALMSYPELDRWGCCISYTKVFKKTVGEMCAEYPECSYQIRQPNQSFGNPRGDSEELEVIKYVDADQYTLYIPEANNLVLASNPNPFGKCPVVVARRPGLDDEIRGQFDDVLWVQLAKARLALLHLQAVDNSVNAPLAVPLDVQEIALGPDAVMRTDSPEKIRRVGIEMSPAAAQGAQLLENEQRTGSRYPEARSGLTGTSQLTGRGIQELMGGFDTQVKGTQMIFTSALREVFEMAFAMDEKFWPNTTKTVRGEAQGSPFTLSYTPSRDINGDHTIHVSYGLAAGMDPNRWLVFMLQMRQDELVPREFVQRQMPFDVDVTAMQRQIDVEQTRDALKHAVTGLAEAVPQMLQQGADASHIIAQFSTLVERLQRGDAFEVAATAAFAPPPPSPAGLSGSPGDPGATGGGPGLPPPGSPAGVVPPGGAPMQGGPPTLQRLLGQMTGKEFR
jgi:hypothetical protein